MSEGRKLYLLMSAELRDLWRWARQHLYALLMLSPLVLGMTYATLARVASYDLMFGPPPAASQVLFASLGVLALIALNLSRASQELYHLRHPASVAEVLAVARETHLLMALLMRLGRTLVLALALLVLRLLLNERDAIDAASLCALALLMALLAVAEGYAALNWIHWGSRRSARAASLAVMVLLATALIGGLLLVLFLNPGAVTRMIRGLAHGTRFLTTQGTAPLYFSIYAAGCLSAGAVYLLTRRAHERWRATDIDYAKRLERASRLGLKKTDILKRYLPQSVAAMLTRDLRLTWRIFSSAVYVAGGVSVLLILLLLALLTTDVLPPGEEFLGGLKEFDWASATWLPASLAIKLTCVLTVAATGAVLPVLVHYQLPHLWLERAAGATGEQVWLAKLWDARLVSLPPTLTTYAVGVVACALSREGNGLPLFYLLPLLAECLWLWWLASSIVGVLSFEMPDQPGLAIVLMIALCVSVGTLTTVLWPMGLAVYGMGIAQARERGGARARYFLATEEE